jgi:hypothetical protein
MRNFDDESLACMAHECGLDLSEGGDVLEHRSGRRESGKQKIAFAGICRGLAAIWILGQRYAVANANESP